MCAVPILICSHWAARGTNMVRCLAAPLSPREISQLLDLRHGKSQSDPAGFKRFIMLGLVEERPGGFAITESGRQRLDAELRAESANRGRPPLFGR
jgi:hypothetical protein